MRVINKSLLILSAILSSALFFAAPASAVSATDWKPGRIIDDVIFTDKNSMNVQQIQDFLTKKTYYNGSSGVPCDTKGERLITYTWDHDGDPNTAKVKDTTSRALYVERLGLPRPPYVCITGYYENPDTKENNLEGRPIPAGAKSAAQIIWDAGQAYGISPKTLIVLLQKESSLITDDWPWPTDYEQATGYKCYDGQPCDPTYAGFYNQVKWAAYQYTRYMNYPDQYNHKVGVKSNVRYSASYTDCGSLEILMETAATAALYNYTPYTPNGAALSNMYGTGDRCSEYGNRNFWRIFNDWFGPTIGKPFDYAFVSAVNAPRHMNPGQPFTAAITIKNTGNNRWLSDGHAQPAGEPPVRLSIKNYSNTPFAGNTNPVWVDYSKNQVRMYPDAVYPGENATFYIPMSAPYQLMDSYVNHFVPVVDGVGFMRDDGMKFVTSVTPPAYGFISAVNPPAKLLPNQAFTASVTIRNGGLAPWYADGSVPAGHRPTRLSGVSHQSTSFANSSDPAWLGTRSQVKMTPAVVQPGEHATFTLPFVGPWSAKNEEFRFTPLIEGTTFLPNIGMRFKLVTDSPNFGYQFVSAVNPPSVMAPGQVVNASVSLKNTGNTIWRNEANRIGGKGSTRIAMIRPQYRNSAFYNSADTAWLAANQVRLTESEVLPGQTGTFTFTWKAPGVGKYDEHFGPVVDMVGFMADVGMKFTVTVE